MTREGKIKKAEVNFLTSRKFFILIFRFSKVHLKEKLQMQNIHLTIIYIKLSLTTITLKLIFFKLIFSV